MSLYKTKSTLKLNNQNVYFFNLETITCQVPEADVKQEMNADKNR